MKKINFLSSIASTSLLLAQGEPRSSALPVPGESTTILNISLLGRDPSPEIKAFLDARTKNIRAGRIEPHYALLKSMASSKNVTERLWALARLVEAGDMDAYIPYGEGMVKHVRGTVQSGSGFGNEKALLAKEVIGMGAPEATEISLKSPFWLSLAKTFEDEPDAPVDTLMYSIWCYNTAPDQRNLIEKVARQIKSRASVKSQAMDPWSDPRFWIVTDWAIAWGDEQDFGRLEQLLQDSSAKREFQRRFNALKKIQAFLPCLASNRAHREKSVESVESVESAAVPREMGDRLKIFEGAAAFQFSNVKIQKQPKTPDYPPEAKARRLMADMSVEITIDPSGIPCMVRAKPGPFLAFFAPTCLEFSAGWRFKPAELNGIPQYARFLLNMPFRLHP